MENYQGPVSLCEAWLEKRVKTMSPRSLVEISLRKIVMMIKLYPNASMEKKLIIHKNLQGLFSVPSLFIQELQENILNAIQVASCKTGKNSFLAADTFLVKKLLHPTITNLDMERIPPIFRNFIIHNVKKMSRLNTLTLCLSMTMSWSSFFSDIQTERFCRGILMLRVLVFQDFADDTFLGHVGKICHNLIKLDVQGSVFVTDTGLSKLGDLLKLRYLDVNRTEVSGTYLYNFLKNMPNVVSLGTWDDFSTFLEDTCIGFVEIRSASLTQSQIEVMSSLCPNLVSLELKITNNSYKLQKLCYLLSLTSLSVSGVNYRQSRLVVAMLALAQKLQSLSFDHVNGLDTGDLRTIGQDCTKLQWLTLSNCTVSSNLFDHADDVQPTGEGNTKHKLFHSLRNLVISSNISPSQFLVITGHAYNLETLHTGISCWVSTRLLSHLFKLNSMEKLLTLRFDHTADLSAPALFLILRKATNLRTIVGTETWQEMDIRTCNDLTDLFDRQHLPHKLVPFHSQHII